jgi:AmmeMemoRadiSam system protein B/AmmeMemoRadiSam system protein A
MPFPLPMKIESLIIIAFLLSIQPVAKAQDVRKPEVAGLFYPLDASALSDSINRYLATAPSRLSGDRLLGIIAPHAGYEFSGQTAAQVYRQIDPQKVRTVFVLGPSHKQTYQGAALHHASAWETPLGILRVDTAAEREILNKCPFVHTIDSAFTKEHSVEDQLPFIQKSLGNVSIVPIAMGAMQMNDLFALSSAIWRIVQESHGSAIVVASSDMSHYQTLARTLARDSVATTDVISLDADKLAGDIERGTAELCGYASVITLMMIAEQAGAEPRLIAYSNSARTTRDTNRVVGYGAFTFTIPPRAEELDNTQQQELLRIARMTVDSFVISKKPPTINISDTSLLRKQGAFVTLTKKGTLRGCIGYILPSQPLARTVYEVAQSACAKDPRFPAVKPDELKELRVEISALGPLHRVRSLDQIVLGTSGLFIQKGDKHGLLLPQVPGQFGWDKNEFLKQLALKAGLHPDDWKAADTKIYAFTAQVFGE